MTPCRPIVTQKNPKHEIRPDKHGTHRMTLGYRGKPLNIIRFLYFAKRFIQKQFSYKYWDFEAKPNGENEYLLNVKRIPSCKDKPLYA